MCSWQVAECDHIRPHYINLLFQISTGEREGVMMKKYLETHQEVCYMLRMGEPAHVNFYRLEVGTPERPSNGLHASGLS